MINITFNSEEYTLHIKGHAKYAKNGEDIVCAAVSALFYTLGEALYDSRDMLTEKHIFKDEKGKGFISCKPKPEYEANIARTYWTILIGLDLIAKNYNKNVRLHIVG